MALGTKPDTTPLGFHVVALAAGKQPLGSVGVVRGNVLVHLL